jgi:hypothetical protein
MLAGPGFFDEIGHSTFHGSTFHAEWFVHDRPHAQRLRRRRVRDAGYDLRREPDRGGDGTLVRSRELERTNREIAERLDVAIGTIRSVIEEDAS